MKFRIKTVHDKKRNLKTESVYYIQRLWFGLFWVTMLDLVADELSKRKFKTFQQAVTFIEDLEEKREAKINISKTVSYSGTFKIP